MNNTLNYQGVQGVPVNNLKDCYTSSMEYMSEQDFRNLPELKNSTPEQLEQLLVPASQEEVKKMLVLTGLSTDERVIEVNAGVLRAKIAKIIQKGKGIPIDMVLKFLN